MDAKKITILSCGGTIDKYQFVDDIDKQIGDPQILNILKEGNSTLDIELVEVLRKDSLNINHRDREKIKQAVIESKSEYIVITHGTDSLIETACTLLDISHKTIVLTGAMIPALLKNTDAIFNVGTAIMAVQNLPAGVYITMNGQLFNPEQCKKDYAKGIFVATE